MGVTANETEVVLSFVIVCFFRAQELEKKARAERDAIDARLIMAVVSVAGAFRHESIAPSGGQSLLVAGDDRENRYDVMSTFTP